jgi:two-component system chemotaxis response regulator CheY
MRTLIVDDDHVCRYVLQQSLQPYSAITYAVDGISAIAEVARALAEHQPYDLICLDIMMPAMDGKQTLKIIRHLEGLFDVPACRVAMTTAVSERETIFESFRNQADLYFIKPLEINQILSELKKLHLLPTT